MIRSRPALIAAGATIITLGGLWLWKRRQRLALENGDTKEREEDYPPTPKIEVVDLPVVDLEVYMNKENDPERARRECEKVANAFHDFGVLVVRDPRARQEHNARFLDMMEKYFESSDGERDARPSFGYQVGVTPEKVEKPRNHCQRMMEYTPGNEPISLCPPELDAKWRFFWRVGPRPLKTRFEDTNPEPVIPPEFSEWEEVMDMWGNKMLDALKIVAAMASEGFGLEPDTFPKMMEMAPHLLAPTGSDFNKYGKLHTILAGYHYDLNFITIHGKSRFPGLYIWTREGQKVRVVVPEGCLLVQAGKQLEYLTGGHVLAGFHEVVVMPETLKVIEDKKKQGKSLWRVSSTCFGHVASDNFLEPLGHFATEEALERYPRVYTGEQVKDELDAIALGTGFSLNRNGK